MKIPQKENLLDIILHGRRKQLESGEAIRRISIQGFLFSYLIVAKGSSF